SSVHQRKRNGILTTALTKYAAATPSAPQRTPTTNETIVIEVDTAPHLIRARPRPVVMYNHPVVLDSGWTSAARLSHRKIGAAPAHCSPNRKGTSRPLVAPATAIAGVDR